MERLWGSARLVTTALFTSFANLSRATANGRRALHIRFTAIRQQITLQRREAAAVAASQNVPTGSKRSRDAYDVDGDRTIKRRSVSPAVSEESIFSFDTVSTAQYNRTFDGFGRYDDKFRFAPPPPRKKSPARNAEERLRRRERRSKKIQKRRAALGLEEPSGIPTAQVRKEMRQMLEIYVQQGGVRPEILDEMDEMEAIEAHDAKIDEEIEARKKSKLDLRRSLQEEAQGKRILEMSEEEKFRREKAKKKKRLAAMRKEQERREKQTEFLKAKDDYDRYLHTIGQLQEFSIAETGPDGIRRLDKYGRLITPTKKVEKKKYILPLTNDWEEKVNKALATRAETAIMGKSVEGVELSRKDIGRVLPGEPWLNDEIVNAFYANLCGRLNEIDGYVKGPNNVPRYVAYSTAWYKSATERGVNSIAGWSRRKGIKGDKLLRTERIFFPTNTGAHWTLLTISGKNKTIEYFDSMNTRGFASKKYTSLATAWLKLELGAKFKEDEWTILQSKSAQQDNMNDCGVFACLNGWALVRGTKDPSEEFGAKDIPMARRMLVATILNGGFTGDFDLQFDKAA
ncbi:hypothetical protein CAC42_5368 [Sphaceloma murrayae]|uniref:Ubiquitin-like protease family profile domain-containing protein n=1 Tax=Sphaceloma murrayae TaxID=2082308 RepID=A0A2K1QUY7_9PEZI|nr:hypothetical protein CAC42_5368 [Sphaceloma murrayae]